MNTELPKGNPSEPSWHKSSFSSSSDGEDCIEVAVTTESVHVRDSKDITGPRITVPPAAWNAFVAHAAES